MPTIILQLMIDNVFLFAMYSVFRGLKEVKVTKVGCVQKRVWVDRSEVEVGKDLEYDRPEFGI